MSDDYMVTRCICDDITFAEIKKISAQRGYVNVHQLADAQICANNCKMCIPYIHRMLKTGKTAFKEIEERSNAY